MKLIDKLRILLLCAGVAALACTLSSCGDRDASALLERVPSSAVIVQKWDMEKVLSNAGVTVGDERLQLSDDLTRMLDVGDSRLLSTLMGMPALVDLKEVVTYVTADYVQVISFGIKDTEAFQRVIEKESGSKPTKRSGFALYDLGGVSLMVKGQTGWLSASADAVVRALDEAKSERFGQRLGLDQFLASDAAVTAAVSCDAVGFPVWSGGWFCLSVRLNGPIMSGELTVMDADGRRVTLDNMLGGLDTDFLRYVPENSVVVAALGNMQNKAIIRALLPANYEWLSEYIDKIDGTTSFYAAPASAAPGLEDFDYEGWNMQGMTHMPQADVDQAVQTLAGQVSGAGMRLTRDKGQYSFTQGDVDIYFGNFDGYFTIAANRPISGDYNNSLTETFAGKRGAAAIEVPYGSEVMKAWGLPYGVSLRIGLESDKATFRLRFHGTDKQALEALMEIMHNRSYGSYL